MYDEDFSIDFPKRFYNMVHRFYRNSYYKNIRRRSDFSGSDIVYSLGGQKMGNIICMVSFRTFTEKSNIKNFVEHLFFDY